jgi:uncharacterized damage-inducible protein DinB
METIEQISHQLQLNQVLIQAFEGHNAHVGTKKALEGLSLKMTGKKILNTPYTIWQLLKHINYWQDKFLNRLQGNDDVLLVCNWQEGWEEQPNAEYQEELDREIQKIDDGIEKAIQLLHREGDTTVSSIGYKNKYDVLQAMASHLSYHLGEVILLRRIFGSWQMPSKGSFYGSNQG